MHAWMHSNTFLNRKLPLFFYQNTVQNAINFQNTIYKVEINILSELSYLNLANFLASKYGFHSIFKRIQISKS